MFLYILPGLTALHGILTAQNALKNYKQTNSEQGSLVIELICASLLVLACLIMLMFVVFNVTSLLSFICGYLLATVATLPLIVVDTIKVISAVRQKRGVWRNLLKLVLNCFALLIYLTFVLWMSVFFVFALSGEPYMGN